MTVSTWSLLSALKQPAYLLLPAIVLSLLHSLGSNVIITSAFSIPLQHPKIHNRRYFGGASTITTHFQETTTITGTKTKRDVLVNSRQRSTFVSRSADNSMMFMAADASGDGDGNSKTTVPLSTTSSTNKVSLADSYVVHINDDTDTVAGSLELSKDDRRTYSTTWTLVPLPTDASTSNGVGTMAIDALKTSASTTYDQGLLTRRVAGGIVTLTCKGCIDHSNADATIQIDKMVDDDFQKEGDKDDHDDENLQQLIDILSRVAVQTVAKYISSDASTNTEDNDDADDKKWVSITLPPTTKTSSESTTERYSLSSILSQNGNSSLFASHLSPADTSTTSAAAKQMKIIEMSDMVDSDGHPLGYIPRSLVHKFNILHRGIGIVVCRDTHIRNDSTANADPNNERNEQYKKSYENDQDDSNNETTTLPSIYVHRRTDTKRIFPGLYDMFVGGVSTTGEESPLTAAREVAEELGLIRALLHSSVQQQSSDVLDNNHVEEEMALSDPLFKCIICTAYNRCVVTMFTYKYISGGAENVKWQEEEVAWGDFVPYDVVERAASLSIRRLKEGGNWPGAMVSEDDGSISLSDDGTNDLKLVSHGTDENQWQAWDFVPDGLLVWEAWVDWMNKN